MGENGTKWAVVGGGHAGQAIAGLLGLQGHDVKLYDVYPELVSAINAKGGIQMQDDLNGFAPVTLASTEMKDVLTPDREFVAVVIPTAFYDSVAEKCAPYIKKDQIVLLFPESTLGAYAFWKRAKGCGAEDFIPVACNQLIYCCRAWAPGLVNVNGHKEYVGIAAIPAHKTEYVVEKMRPFFPQMRGLKNALESSLTNFQAIVHPIPLVMNLSRVENKEEWNPYFDGVTKSIAAFMDKVDAERLAIGRAYGFELDGMVTMYRDMYAFCSGETIYDVLQTCSCYRKIQGWKELDTRYLYEDLPYSLVPMIALAKLAGVETPHMEAFRTISYMLVGEYLDEGRTFEALGFDRMTKEQFVREIVNG